MEIKAGQHIIVGMDTAVQVRYQGRAGRIVRATSLDAVEVSMDVDSERQLVHTEYILPYLEVGDKVVLGRHSHIHHRNGSCLENWAGQMDAHVGKTVTVTHILSGSGDDGIPCVRVDLGDNAWRMVSQTKVETETEAPRQSQRTYKTFKPKVGNSVVLSAGYPDLSLVGLPVLVEGESAAGFEVRIKDVGFKVDELDNVPKTLIGKVLEVTLDQLAPMLVVGDIVSCVAEHPRLEHLAEEEEGLDPTNWTARMDILRTIPGVVAELDAYLGVLGAKLNYDHPPVDPEESEAGAKALSPFWYMACMAYAAPPLADEQEEDVGDVLCHTCAGRVGVTYPVTAQGRTYELCRKCLTSFQCQFSSGASAWLMAKSTQAGMVEEAELRVGQRVLVTGPPVDPYVGKAYTIGSTAASWNPVSAPYIGMEAVLQRIETHKDGRKFYFLDVDEGHRAWNCYEIRSIKEEKDEG